MENKLKITGFDKVSLWLSKAYIWLMILFLGIYTGLPFLAPVLLKYGINTPAKIIYTIYKPLCHQLAFRSWFLFGEQAFYPREKANLEYIQSFEDVMGIDQINIREAQRFTGSESLGYKVALCQRDIAIYGSMFLFGLIFVLLKRKVRPIKWYYWVIFAILPVGFDGVSQLPGLISNLPEWIPARESNPYLRTITGGMFGFFTAWYFFPLIEESMNETRMVLTGKINYIKSIGKDINGSQD